MSLQRGAVITTHPGHHWEIALVISEDPLHLWDDSILRENLQTLLPVEYIVGLPGVEEYFAEDLPPNFCQLMNKLGFEGGGPYSPTLPEATEDITKLY